MRDLVGIVVGQLPRALYHVKLESGHHVTAHVAGRLDVSVMRVLVGDRVRLELSPIDAQRGRIVAKVAEER